MHTLHKSKGVNCRPSPRRTKENYLVIVYESMRSEPIMFTEEKKKRICQ